MTRPFRFGVQTGDLTNATTVADYAKQVEALGYDELYSSDHFGTTFGLNAVDPFVSLVVAAQAAPTLRVGPLVLNNEFHQPALLARTAISVDQMTGGRLVLGLGTGYAQAEHDAIGVPLLPPGKRVTRFGESLRILRSLCDTGSCTFDGEFHHVEVDDMGITPAQERLPFLIGGHGRRVVTLAGEHADIFQFTGLTHGQDGTPSGGGFALSQIAERSRWLSDAAGERDAEIERSALVQFTAVGRALSSAEQERMAKFEAVIDASPFLLAGSPAQIIDKLERQRDQLGISHYVIRDAEGFAPIVEALAGK